MTQASNNPDLVYQLDNQTSGASWNSQYPIEAFQMMQKLQQNGVFEAGAGAVTYDEALALFIPRSPRCCPSGPSSSLGC